MQFRKPRAGCNVLSVAVGATKGLTLSKLCSSRGLFTLDYSREN